MKLPTIRWVALPGLLLLIALVRLSLLQIAPLSYFAYDFGFYQYALTHNSAGALIASLPGIFSGFSTPALVLIKSFSQNPESALTCLIILADILLAVALFLWLKTKNVFTATLAVLFLTLSSIQNQVTILYLLKTAVALPCFILGLYFFETKQWKYFIPTTLAVLWLHRTTAIVYIAVTILSVLLEHLRTKQWKRFFTETCFGAGGLLAIYLFFGGKLYALVQHANSDVVSGVFFQGRSLFGALWIIVPLGVWGVIRAWKNKTLYPAIAGIMFTLPWMLLQLPFYERMLIYFDLSLIILAAYAIGDALKKQTLLEKSSMAALLVFGLGIQSLIFIANTKPLVATDTIQEIQSFHPTGPEAFVLAIDANDAPWLLSNIQGVELPKNYSITTPLQPDFHAPVRLGAPGLFEDPKSKDGWDKLWKGADKQTVQEFMSAFPKPLYIYEHNFHLSGNGRECLQPISKNFSKYTCN